MFKVNKDILQSFNSEDNFTRTRYFFSFYHSFCSFPQKPLILYYEKKQLHAGKTTG